MYQVPCTEARRAFQNVPETGGYQASKPTRILCKSYQGEKSQKAWTLDVMRKPALFTSSATRQVYRSWLSFPTSGKGAHIIRHILAIDKTLNKKYHIRMAKVPEPETKRNNNLAKDYLEKDDGGEWKYTVKQLSEKYSISRNRVYQILAKQDIPRNRR